MIEPAHPTRRGFPPDLAAAVARAGVDPTVPPRALQDALKGAIADRGGYVAWDVDEVGWRVSCSGRSGGVSRPDAGGGTGLGAGVADVRRIGRRGGGGRARPAGAPRAAATGYHRTNVPKRNRPAPLERPGRRRRHRRCPRMASVPRGPYPDCSRGPTTRTPATTPASGSSRRWTPSSPRCPPACRRAISGIPAPLDLALGWRPPTSSGRAAPRELGPARHPGPRRCRGPGRGGVASESPALGASLGPRRHGR